MRRLALMMGCMVFFCAMSPQVLSMPGSDEGEDMLQRTAPQAVPPSPEKKNAHTLECVERCCCISPASLAALRGDKHHSPWRRLLNVFGNIQITKK